MIVRLTKHGEKEFRVARGRADDQPLFKVVRLTKDVENAFAGAGRRADAVVAHLDDQMTFSRAAADGNHPTFWCISGGIANQISEDLEEPIRIHNKTVDVRRN